MGNSGHPCGKSRKIQNGPLHPTHMNRLSRIALCFVLASATCLPSLAQILTPQGRLTLQSNTPVMTSDVTGATTIYYTPYVGTYIPLYNGTSWVNTQFSQLTLTLYSNNMPGPALYDVYVFLNSGTPTIGVGIYGWSSLTARSGVDLPSQTLSPVLADNNESDNLLNGSTVYTRTVSPVIAWATYVGTIYVSATGTTSVQFKPSAAAGGSNNVIGIWNAYNRVPISSLESDSTTGFTYSGTTWEPLDDNVHNRVTYLDGLGLSPVSGQVTTIAYNTNNGNGTAIGIDEDSTSNTPLVRASYQSANASGIGASNFAAEENFTPAIGFHYLQAMQQSPNGTTSTFAFNGSQTFLLYRGEY
jgi:hypothetical protein